MFKDDQRLRSGPSAALLWMLGGDEDLALVIYGSVFETATDWVGQKIPALDGRSIKECIESESGMRDVRSMLMRLPR